jgi:hypothetical protein
MLKWNKIRANKYCLYVGNNLDINLYLVDNGYNLRISTYLTAEGHKEDLKTFFIAKESDINNVLEKAKSLAIQVVKAKLTKYKSAVKECEDLLTKLGVNAED